MVSSISTLTRGASGNQGAIRPLELGSGCGGKRGTVRVAGACSMPQKLKVKAVAVRHPASLGPGQVAVLPGRLVKGVCPGIRGHLRKVSTRMEPVGGRINTCNPPKLQGPRPGPRGCIPPPRFPVLRSPTSGPSQRGKSRAGSNAGTE